MSEKRAILITGVLLIAASAGAQQNPIRSSHAVPVAHVKTVVDEYFGVKVSDPYRYMEDLKDPEVAAWFRGQNDHTRAVLERIPGRNALLQRIRELDEGAPAVVSDERRLPDDRFFYRKRLATEETPRLYTRNGLNGAEKLLVNPEKFKSAVGPHYAIDYYLPSLDGRFVAFGVSQGGSEDAVLHVLNVETGQETGDVIDRGQFGSPGWLPDGRSFVYTRLQKLGTSAAPTDKYLNSRVYLHVMGMDPEKDKLVFGIGLPRLQIAPADIPFAVMVPGSAYAVGIIAHGVQNELTLYAAPLESLRANPVPWVKVCDVADQITSFDVRGDEIYLLSHSNASRFKVLRTRLSHPNVSHADVVIPSGQAVIRNLYAAQDALYVQEIDAGIGHLLRLPYGSRNAEEVSLPVRGVVSIPAIDARVSGALLELTSWTRARKLYVYDPSRKLASDSRLQPAGKFDEPPGIESIEVRAKSYDGISVPLSIVYRKGVKLDGSNPTLLLGYGSYGISLDPFFDPRMLAWIERGGVYAIAHVRGGGEYGEDWHLAGKQLTKQNTWRDFIACAQFLLAQKYTSSSRLAIEGGSAGGITVGRSITERPDLFAVAIDAVPMSDVVRAEFTPNGPPNIPEFGTVKNEKGFKGLYEMSAYHHVKDGTPYPAVMVTTGFNDPRVISWEPGKMAARLQAATSSKKPILLRVDYDAGHGFGSQKSQREAELGDELSFALWQTGEPGFQPN